MLKYFVLGTTLWLVFGCAPTEEVTDATGVKQDRPNIVLIVADDLGYTDLGAFGGEISTPNLDQLANNGVRLTNFHTSASCAPTRAMLLTGTDNHIAGMGSQGTLVTPQQAKHRAYQNRLLPEVPTFTESLQKAGYRTYMAGKWHLGYVQESRPAARGFDHSFALMQGGAGHFDDTELFADYGATWLEDDEPVVLPTDFYSSDFLVETLKKYISGTPSEQPYFAYLSFTAPHWPLQAPATSIAKYKGVYDAGWDLLRAKRMAGAQAVGVVPIDAEAVDFEASMVPWNALNELEKADAVARMKVYAAMVDRLDENVGLLLKHIEARGELDNTVFIFLSDNGAEGHDMESPTRHGEWLTENFDNSVNNIGTKTSYVALKTAWARATAAPFRDSKSKVSEGGIRVPAFFSLPNQAGNGGGRIDSAYMRVMDLGETILELAQGEPNAQSMGRSLLPRWRGGVAPYAEDEVIAFEVYGRRGAQRGPWKILLQEPPYGTSEWQLYNLDRDLGEQEDLSDEHPKIRTALIAAWTEYAREVGVVLPEIPPRY